MKVKYLVALAVEISSQAGFRADDAESVRGYLDVIIDQRLDLYGDKLLKVEILPAEGEYHEWMQRVVVAIPKKKAGGRKRKAA